MIIILGTVYNVLRVKGKVEPTKETFVEESKNNSFINRVFNFIFGNRTPPPTSDDKSAENNSA